MSTDEMSTDEMSTDEMSTDEMSTDEMSTDDMSQHAELIVDGVTAALEARDLSYSPYSDFPMGAAVVASDGTIARGALIENVSLGLAMCSERVALFTAVTASLSPVVLVLASKRTDDALTFPCGACLQVALEIAGPDLIVVAVDLDGEHEATTLGQLLPRAPHRFTATDAL